MLRGIFEGAASWGAALHELSRAQARWELQAARTILRRRKGVLLAVIAPVLVGLALQMACADDLLPDKIPILGGSKAYTPLVADGTMLVGSVLVGLIAGLITGVIGAGGGYILTPALMSFGVRGIMAVGTDQFHIFAKAIMGATIHSRLGNVSIPLAASFVAGSLLGVTAGGKVNRAVFLYSPALSDALISTVYVLVLGVLGIYAVCDWLRARRSGPEQGDPTQATTRLAQRLQALPLKPKIGFDHRTTPGGRRIPIYPVIACGFIVGFVAAIMGVGGGFLTFPMFVYGLGVSTLTTVGTDILQLVFTTSYSSITQYAVYGFVFYTVAVGMLVGSLVGVQVGAMVTQIVDGAQIRVYYALTILAGFSNRLFALPRKLADLGYMSAPRSLTVPLEVMGTVLFFAIVGVFALWILLVFVKHLSQRRAVQSETAAESRSGWVAQPWRLKAGIAGLVSLGIVLTVSLCPVFEGHTGLTWADGFFNQLAKNSADHLAEGRAKANALVGTHVDVSVNPKDVVDQEQLSRIVAMAGLDSRVIGDGRVRITGDLGKLAKAAVDDAALQFDNRSHSLARRRQMTASEAIYCWWIIFDGLTRRYVQENRGSEANFTKFVSAKILEPCYNFRGIKAMQVRNRVIPLVLLLGCYILFTLWYGFSILNVFEGLDMTTVPRGEREEI